MERRGPWSRDHLPAFHGRQGVYRLYFAHASFGATYSAAGSPIVVLLWVYYSAQLFFWGAEFTKVYAKTLGSQRLLLVEDRSK
jgi:uncharacterized BrkB/YihY/UPF0761 family membrane protein